MNLGTRGGVKPAIFFSFVAIGIVKGKGVNTCYSIAYVSQTRDQQRFRISEVAADWYESMVPQSAAHNMVITALGQECDGTNGQLDQRCS